MSLPPQRWNRPYFTPGGDDASLLYVVFGNFPQPLSLSASEYRSNGVPEGVELSAYHREQEREFIESIYGGWLGQSLQSEDAELFAAVERAPMCLVMQEEVPDPTTLDYLRDAVGVLTALLDNGGAALLDWQALAWFSPERWRERIFAPNAPVPRHHVSILLSPEADEQVWIHTRGMRKFGRPDLSVRNVSSEYQDACIELCNRFIERLAFGERVPEGQPVRMQGLPPGMVCRHRGDADDPAFNNVHIEIERSV